MTSVVRLFYLSMEMRVAKRMSNDDLKCAKYELERERERKAAEVTGETSDGYHTFNELYYHRMVLFSIICNNNKEVAFKSKLHADGTMFDDYFIVGVNTPNGYYTYHYHTDDWGMFDVAEVDRAPEWDGHKPSDIRRLLTL